MADIFVIDHHEMPDPDRGITHLQDKGFNVQIVQPHNGEPLPELDGNTAGVMLMGGAQYVTELEASPFLKDEMAFSENVMSKDIPLLGICLGAQMIAHQLGADVGFHPEENVAFGYYDVIPTEEGRDLFPETLVAPSGNRQGFDVPDGATLLAQGDIFKNQAFRVGKTTIAFQFHPELTRPILDKWQVQIADSYGLPGAQTREQQDANFERYDADLHTWFTGFLDGFFGGSERSG